MYIICKLFEKTMLMLLYCFINSETTFSNFLEFFFSFFFRYFLKYTDYAHKISHAKPFKYDSTFGTKILICLKKVGDEAVDRNKHF